MSLKDIFVAAGIVLTAVIGLLNLGYSFRHNRRSSYVSSVTSTRLQWIGDVRDRLARFVALNYELAKFPPADAADRQKIIAEISQLRTLLRLHLAPAEAELDREFEDKIESVYEIASGTADIEWQLDDLVVFGQGFLWKEWRKVKDETIRGDPYDTLPYRSRIWMERLLGVSDPVLTRDHAPSERQSGPWESPPATPRA